MTYPQNQSYFARNGLLVGAEQVPDYMNISVADYQAAYAEVADAQKAAFDAIIASDAPPTYANTITPFLDSDDAVGNLIYMAYSHTMVNATDEMMDLRQDLLTRNVEQYAGFIQNPDFAARVKVVQENAASLTPVEARLLEKVADQFVDYGTMLDAASQQRIKDIEVRLTELTTDFMKNLRDGRNANAVYFADLDQLAGVNQNDIETFAAHAREAGKDSGYLVVPERLLVDKLLAECTNRDTRAALYTALTTTCANGSAFATENLIKEICDLRAERAALCGFENYAEYVLRNRMVKSVAELDQVLVDGGRKLFPHFAQEIETVTAYAEANGHEGKLEPWDIDFWMTRYKAETFAIDMAALEPYLHTDSVVVGLLADMEAFYDVTINKAEDLPTTHEDVTAYRVHEAVSGRLLAVLMVDMYARPATKEGGAWMSEFRARSNDGSLPAIIGLQMNMTRPAAGQASIIDIPNTETLFHEQGHVMHGILGQDQPHNIIRGTNVATDFVEMPSQILENFVHEPDFMAQFLRHHETGEECPVELLGRLAEYSSFGRAQPMLKIIQNSRYDLAMHMSPDKRAGSLDDIMARETISSDISPLVRPYQLYRFDHLFSSSGAYAVGYYSYYWSDVLDAQAYDRVKHTQDGRRNLIEALKSGGSEDETALFTRLFGPVDPSYALARAGVNDNDSDDAPAASPAVSPQAF
jgi:peptidyl-dipeptidase Dcp